MLKKLTLLGISITSISRGAILESVKGYLEKRSVKPFVIVTPNPEQVILAQENNVFRDVLNSADIALPDGVGIAWSSKILHLSPVTYHLSPIPGISFMEDLVKLAVEEGYPVAFIGGWNGVAQKALDKLKEKYPELKGWAEEPPELTTLSNLSDRSYLKKVTDKIRDSRVRLVFVALGAPKQEFFINELQHHSSLRGEKRRSNLKEIAAATSWPRNDNGPMILMSVGGSFDELSGKIPRSPEWISKVGLKWLWRLILEPWRIGRQLRLIKFIWLVLKQRVSGKI